ncbi:hypothetical protein E3P81_03167 [Wallemia ichthyophaga]|uniref:peptidylprolyl isomerase n=1 Tax=Wallemia ichthyophaga TaxID=245174 RepID=A0A4T0FL55_WALIC|nr:hypothetical protein E3P91_02881 [Wallemia ichthyophaga]TIA80258.1 hypothetical protein E3P98_02775 [Wallemia ichthyophaga]TIA89081.1 hypothetical protein E3P97_03247 [Wallemia ichthyophaga]TIB30154.1 hypothetical protein E3P85_02855 [Wallemia ichthyophaga]TIB38706.1 hypothetical protein E3P86_01493 [Wallemia ichthyophaga]
MTTLGLWSQVLLPNSPSILEIDDDIRITNVALSESSSSKSKSVIKLMYEPQDDSESDEEAEEQAADKTSQEVVLCSLIPGQIEQVSLDLTITANDLVSISVTGNNEVHLLGNLVSPNLPHPQDGDSDDDESDLDEDEMRALYGQDVSMDDDEEDDDQEDGPKIEELPDEPISKPSKKRAAEEAPAKPSKKEKKEVAAEKKEEPKKAEKIEKTEKKENKDEKKEDKRVTLSNGVSYKDAKIGDGPVAKSGKRIGMRYIGRVLKDGKPQKKVFDQNTSGKPFSFRVGTGEVISGWDTGVLGAVNGKGGQPMRVGGERTLYIPSKQAYGNQALPGIGKNADMTFEVKLVEVK